MDFLIGILAVFAITLIVTKSKIMACKRKFVEQRYLASFVGEQTPSFLHTVWHAYWVCSMCSGFWTSLIIAPWCHVSGYFLDVLALFSANWLLHCLEATLFEIGDFFKKKVDTDDDDV